MKPFGKLVPRLEAVRIIEENIKRIKRIEEAPLELVGERVLAEDVIADFNVPPFDRSSMDGYAVRAKDMVGASNSNPKLLKLVGASFAGELFRGEVGNGECVEIATGSPMPRGADAVVMVEYTSLRNGFVEVQREAQLGDNIAMKGEDIKKGDLVIHAGEQLGPSRIGAVAALGYASVKILAKPRVAVYSTGDEVVAQGEMLRPGQVYDINSFTLSSVIESNGCIPVRMGVVKDDSQSLIKTVKDVSSFDMAVFSGGSSVGSRDLFSSVIEELGVVHFHGLQVKPGKPTLFGVVQKMPIFGMPGYPTSCLSNAYIFLAPALRKMAGLAPKEMLKVIGRLSQEIRVSGDREQFYTVKLEEGVATPVFKQSGDITSMAYANGLIIIPIGTKRIAKGAEVEVALLE